MNNDFLEDDDIYIYDDTKITIEDLSKSRIVDEEYIKKCLNEIKLEVVKQLKDEGYITVIDGKDISKMGCCHREWEITRKMMKERYNIDWQSPQNQFPEIDFD